MSTLGIVDTEIAEEATQEFLNLPRRLVMKRFIVSVLCVSVFFIGLGALVDKVGAKFKSDEKALELIRQARTAVGGEQAIAAIRSITISGKTSQTFSVNGAQRSEQGDEEIALQLPDKFSKQIKLGKQDGAAGEKTIVERHDVLVFDKTVGQKVMLGDGETTGIAGK